MGDEMVTTGVDDLLAYCKGKDRVSLPDVATVLNVPMETLQAWVDFLVEEKILGIEYKFTKPYIYLNKETLDKAKVIEHSALSYETVKENWEKHARDQQIPDTKLADLWRSHLTQALDRQKEYFMEQAKRRHATNAESLWNMYRNGLIVRG